MQPPLPLLSELFDLPGVPGRCRDFLADLAPPAIPWHLSAYHPAWRWNAPPTPPATLLARAAMARERLPFVYVGNLPGERNDTACPRCGAVLVRRRGYQVDTGGITGDGGCAVCGCPVIRV